MSDARGSTGLAESILLPARGSCPCAPGAVAGRTAVVPPLQSTGPGSGSSLNATWPQPVLCCRFLGAPVSSPSLRPGSSPGPRAPCPLPPQGGSGHPKERVELCHASEQGSSGLLLPRTRAAQLLSRLVSSFSSLFLLLPQRASTTLLPITFSFIARSKISQGQTAPVLFTTGSWCLVVFRHIQTFQKHT